MYIKQAADQSISILTKVHKLVFTWIKRLIDSPDKSGALS